MFQLLMNKADENTKKTLLISSIYQWNLELTDSELKKPFHEYFHKATFSLENLAELFPIISATFLSYIISFFMNRHLPTFLETIHILFKEIFTKLLKKRLKNGHAFLPKK